MPSQVTLPINGAPSKWDLMLCLFDTTASKRALNFALSQMHEGTEAGLFYLMVEVTSVTRKDDSATAFEFAGDCRYGHRDAKASGWYSTDTRRGFMTIDY